MRGVSFGRHFPQRFRADERRSLSALGSPGISSPGMTCESDGITALGNLLCAMEPVLVEGEFVFCTVADAGYGAYAEHEPIACFVEREGLTLVLRRERADAAALAYRGMFRMITLTVHSSLEAVGLTAAVTTCLAERGISANVIAAHYHDHIFVSAEGADTALQALQDLSARASSRE